MQTSPQKRQHTLPDRQIARAFGFTADDLATNRNGFATRAQLWQIPIEMRPIFYWLTSVIEQRFKQRPSVDILCGRATLRYEQQKIESVFSTDFIEIYNLMINERNFRITARQYQTLADGVTYRVYYYPHHAQIFSIERAVTGC